MLKLPLKVALKVMPVFISIFSAFFKGKKDSLMRFYIKVNNILVQSDDRKYPEDKVLVLLPHCLQYSECPHKITMEIDNCHRCGKCSIASILEIVSENRVIARVVTGGTAARNIVERLKPEIILSVACERDLMSGIVDVKTVPVLGVLNSRPNGPCYNTEVNVSEIKDKLTAILKK